MDPSKPGYKTTEFWFGILAAGAIAMLSAFNPEAAGLPPMVAGLEKPVAMLLLAWLSGKYGDNRSSIKSAAIAAGASAAKDASASVDIAIEEMKK